MSSWMSVDIKQTNEIIIWNTEMDMIVNNAESVTNS